MAAESFLLDTLLNLTISIQRSPGQDAKLVVVFSKGTTAGQFAVGRTVTPSLNASQQTTINNIWDAVRTAAMNQEGLTNQGGVA